MLEISTKLCRKAGHTLTREQICLPCKLAEIRSKHCCRPGAEEGWERVTQSLFSNIAAWTEMTFRQKEKLPDTHSEDQEAPQRKDAHAEPSVRSQVWVSTDEDPLGRILSGANAGN